MEGIQTWATGEIRRLSATKSLPCTEKKVPSRKLDSWGLRIFQDHLWCQDAMTAREADKAETNITSKILESNNSALLPTPYICGD
jgi:hypothetical protein